MFYLNEWHVFVFYTYSSMHDACGLFSVCFFLLYGFIYNVSLWVSKSPIHTVSYRGLNTVYMNMQLKTSPTLFVTITCNQQKWLK